MRLYVYEAAHRVGKAARVLGAQRFLLLLQRRGVAEVFGCFEIETAMGNFDMFPCPMATMFLEVQTLLSLCGRIYLCDELCESLRILHRSKVSEVVPLHEC